MSKVRACPENAGRRPDEFSHVGMAKQRASPPKVSGRFNSPFTPNKRYVHGWKNKNPGESRTRLSATNVAKNPRSLPLCLIPGRAEHSTCMNASAVTACGLRIRPPQLAASFVSNVACWHKTQMRGRPEDVRSSGQSRHQADGPKLPFLALAV
jgi:hypothetical protein